jgi:outer membrane protein with beta-barrel domain
VAAELRAWRLGAVLTVGTLLASPRLEAQDAEFSLSGGVSVPTGDFNDVAKLGWQGSAGVLLVQKGRALGFQLDGSFSQFDLEGPFDVNERFIYGTGNVVYRFESSDGSPVRPYLIGGLGVYNSKGTGPDAPAFGETSQTKFGLNAGAGFNFKAGGAGLFIEGRFHNVFADPSSKQFIPISLGIRFGGS